MGNPLTVDFWQGEEALLYQSLEVAVIASLLQGMEAGATLLPAQLQPLINWDFTNQAAIEFLQAYRVSTVQGINVTTRNQTVSIIQNWLQSGDPLPNLVNQLAPIFGRQRAEMIAVTEVTRVVAKGNQLLWESTGVVSGKRWMTARDERVCPFCQPLDGQVVELSSDFALTPQVMANSEAMRLLMGANFTPEAALQRAGRMLGNVGSTANSPPFHVRCRCWLQPFVSEELLRGQIGDILAGQFFAEVDAGRIQVSYG